MKLIKERLLTMKELINFFWEQKLWWLIPVVILLLALSLMLILAHSLPLAPFLYAII